MILHNTYSDIKLIVDNGSFSDFEDNESNLIILLNGDSIGCVRVNVYPPEMYIEYLHIDDNMQGKGYGTKTMMCLKQLAEQFNIKTIIGESRKSLISFYTKLGATYENRTKYDEELMLNRFYIDL